MTTSTVILPAAHQAALIAAAQGRPGRPVVGGVRVLTPIPALTATGPAAQEGVTAAEVHPPAEAFEQMLRAAEESSKQKTRTLAARVRQLIAELGDQVAVEAEARVAEARVQKLREQLAEAEAKLRSIRSPVAAAVSGDDQAAIGRAVRAWARTNGVEVASHGRVAAVVVEQWRAATGGTI